MAPLGDGRTAAEGVAVVVAGGTEAAGEQGGAWTQAQDPRPGLPAAAMVLTSRRPEADPGPPH